MAKKPQPITPSAIPGPQGSSGSPGSSAPAYRPTASRGVMVASYLLMLAALLLVMWEHLLPGLLCVCIGFLATRWFARILTTGLARIPALGKRPERALGWANVLAVILVLLGPIALLTLALSQAREYIVDAPDQYRELLDYTARTVLELRSKLPVEIAAYLPEGAAEIQRVIANYLRAQAGSLAMAGRAWLHGLLFSYVGLIVGALAAVSHAALRRKPLAEQLHQRVQTFGEAFGQIVAAQFWIAAFNTLLTAIFLLFIMPMWGAHLPYTPALITLTFLAGLVPIVGNLVCNSVITLVGLSVSPVTAAACLIFLIVIHKAEYVINAKVVGARTQMSVWELLAVMFVAEAIFGPAGLVAAPLYYAYLKKELQAAALV